MKAEKISYASLVRVVGRENSAHVLQADAVGAHLLEPSRLRKEVVEVVDRPSQPASLGHGVADGKLQVPATLLDGIGGALDIPLVVQGVEGSEYVDSCFGGPIDEGVHNTSAYVR